MINKTKTYEITVRRCPADDKFNYHPHIEQVITSIFEEFGYELSHREDVKRTNKDTNYPRIVRVNYQFSKMTLFGRISNTIKGWTS